MVPILLILFLVALAWFPDMRPVTENTVWTYWHNPVPPRLVRRCHKNWKKVGQITDIRFLNSINVHKYIPLRTLLRFGEITHTEAHKSDLIRFYLLRHYGGIWIDSSVFFTQALTWLPDGFFCYRADRFSKEGLVCLENFFIKSPKEHPFLVKWMDQTLQEFEDPNYKKTNERYRKIIGGNGDYLVPYVASMKISDKSGINFESAEQGPYFDSEKFGWHDTNNFCKNLTYSSKIVKLWNKQRRECPPSVVPLESSRDYSPAGVYERFKNKFELCPGDYGEVDMVYVISMPSRLEYIKGVVEQLKCQYTLFHAISPKDLTPEDYSNMSETFNPSNKMLYKKMTKLPVCLSFFMCYWDAYTKGYNTIMVLEDDVKFMVSLDLIHAAINEFKKTLEADILFLGYCWANCAKKFEQKTENTYKAPQDVQLLCNHALVMKGSFLREFMTRERPTFWNNRNDHTLSNYLRTHDVGKFVTPKAYVNQNRVAMGSNNENYDTGGKACDLTTS